MRMNPIRGMITGLLVLASTILVGCSRVPPSFTGVLVSNWASDGRGIEPQGRGLVTYNPLTQDLYIFPLHIQRQNYSLAGGNEITVRAGKDNTTVAFDASLSYQFAEDRVADIFEKYRTDPETLAHGYVYQELRNAFSVAASEYAVMDLLGAKLNEMQIKAHDILKAKLEPEGIIVDQVLVVGQPRIDAKIEDAINGTLQAIQEANRQEQKIREIEAIANQRRADAQGQADATITRAKADAEAARLLQQELTPLVLQNHALSKWNGVLPTVTSGATPFIQVPSAGASR